jgi:hypothetical protein
MWFCIEANPSTENCQSKAGRCAAPTTSCVTFSVGTTARPRTFLKANRKHQTLERFSTLTHV